MLRFFRQIRQRLLTDNKFSKYLLYAVGEILLVVIGILIALQINNWNEERKDGIVELDILNELKTTLESEFDLLAEQINGNRKSLAACHVILKALVEGQPYHDSLSGYFTQAFTRVRFLIKDNAYFKAKTYGIDFISDKELKEELLATYEVNGKFLVELDKRNDEYEIGIVYPVLSGLFRSIAEIDMANFPINEPLTNKKVRDSIGYVNPAFNMSPVDFEELKGNETFINILRTTINMRRQTILYQEIRYTRMLRLVAHLNDEIESKRLAF